VARPLSEDVSVVITTYQRPERLAGCLGGVRAQTRPADEVVVVVHSTDRASIGHVEQSAANWPALRWVPVDKAGSLAALNCGLAAAQKSIVAFVDDDAVPATDWLERIVKAFRADDSIAGVGGRDYIVGDGQPDDGDCERTVGRIQWFGRMIGNHHIGVGPPRDVDVLKGTNMSFRRSTVAGHAFDERLRGYGSLVHSELSICLPLKRHRQRVVYDPAIAVTHYPAPRPHGDDRRYRTTGVVFTFSHNEALEILDYFGPLQRVVYGLWAFAIGTTYCPGVVVLLRDLMNAEPAAWDRFRAAQRGRASAWETRRRVPRRALRGPLLHRPAPGWRTRHVFGALGIRPPIAQHSHAEASLLMRHAANARTIVELGVAEGGSAAELRAVMSQTGHLYLIDPYERGRLGMSFAWLVAHRAVNAVRGGQVTWLRSRSDAAVRRWRRPIDFLFIDADHSYDRAASDWRLWTPFVPPGGHVALHDSAVFPGGWTDERSGPVRLLGEILSAERGWSLVDQADSLSIVWRERAAGDEYPWPS
jgi:GT2 family glycosyltransferase/predicted O-methyltransferase YrrM